MNTEHSGTKYFYILIRNVWSQISVMKMSTTDNSGWGGEEKASIISSDWETDGSIYSDWQESVNGAEWIRKILEDCYGLHLDVTSKLQGLIGGALRGWLDYGGLILIYGLVHWCTHSRLTVRRWDLVRGGCSLETCWKGSSLPAPPIWFSASCSVPLVASPLPHLSSTLTTPSPLPWSHPTRDWSLYKLWAKK